MIEEIIMGVELIDVIVTALCGSAAVSEVLPHIKRIKANSVFQLAFNVLKAIAGVFRKQ